MLELGTALLVMSFIVSVNWTFKQTGDISGSTKPTLIKYDWKALFFPPTNVLKKRL